MKPLGMSAYELAKRLHVPGLVSTISYGSAAALATDTAIRLSRFFGTTEQFWLNLQTPMKSAA